MKNIFLFFLFFCADFFAQSLPWNDNFNNNNLSGWTIIDDTPNSDGPSNWKITDGVLSQTSNIFVNTNEIDVHLGTHIFTGSSNWKNYSFSTYAKSSDNDGIGILFRYADKDNYYRFILMNDPNNGGPFQRLQVMLNGQLKTIAEKRVSQSVPKGWFSITVYCTNDSIKTFVNGEPVISVVDDTFKDGKIGLMCYANSGSYFDSVSVSNDFIVYEKPEQHIMLVERLPYIQMPDTSSVLIAWRTIEKNIGKVEYGLTASLGSEVIEDSSSTSHVVKINNLLPATKYYYKVWNGNKVLSEGFAFNTAKPDNVKNVGFLIWGDSGVANEIQYKVAARMEEVADDMDFGIHVGDVNQNQGEEYDETFFKPYKNIVRKMNVYTCIGNHDTNYDNTQTYMSDFYLPHNNSENTERYYSFSYGNTFFINIDTNLPYDPSSSQYKFIVEQLSSEKKQNADWTFAYFHHPPYSEYWDSWSGDENVRRYLLPLFQKYKVDMVFNGHTHSYERGFLNGTYYIITGGGGGGLDTYGRDWPHVAKSLGSHHYTRVDISGKI
jgi:predicted phosphodiesterase